MTKAMRAGLWGMWTALAFFSPPVPAQSPAQSPAQAQTPTQTPAASPTVEAVLGYWDLCEEYKNGPPMRITLSLIRREDGSLGGTWSGLELTSVKYTAGKLTVIQTTRRNDREITQTFEGQLQDGRLVGKIASNRGANPTVGVKFKSKPPILGNWWLKIPTAKREPLAKLSIRQTADGMLQGIWSSQRGENPVEELKFQDGALTFKRKTQEQGQDREYLFTGEVKENTLTGRLKSSQNEFKVDGSREGENFIGTWDVGTSESRGPSRLTIYSDLSARYMSDGRDTLIENINLEGQTISFKVERGFGELRYPIEFKGSLEGDTLKGQFVSPWGPREVTGKKLAGL
jgi:hypothetical protein